MKNLYYCDACNKAVERDSSNETMKSYCQSTKVTAQLKKVVLDCSKMYVGGTELRSYVYIGEPSLYFHSDGVVRHTAAPSSTGWYAKYLAEENLRRFKERMCKSANVVSRQPIHLQLENETAPVIQPITARLVTDHSGGRIVLQVRTSESPEFIPIARLAVKNGQVVMYREQGVDSTFINTDSQGRIQN